MKVKPIAAIAAALCMLSVLIFIAVMIFTVYSAVRYSVIQNIFSDSIILISIMFICSVIASIYVVRAAIDMRKLRRALILEAFYLVALIFSFEKLAMASGALCVYMYGGDVVPISWSLFLPIMTFAPCILSMILETIAYILSRKQLKPTNSNSYTV